MEITETALTEDVLAELIRFSRDWEAENSTFGYRANEKADIEGERIFLAREDGRTVGYLFGHCFDSENMKSIMPEHSRCFEVEELYVIPERPVGCINRGRRRGSGEKRRRLHHPEHGDEKLESDPPLLPGGAGHDLLERPAVPETVMTGV